MSPEETAEMKAVKKKAIDTCPWKDVPAVERTLERWRKQMDEIDKKNKSEIGMAIKFNETRVGISDEYKKQIIDGISQAMADQMQKNAEKLDRGDPLYLMVKLDRFRSNRLPFGDEWLMKVTEVDADAWNEKSNYTNVQKGKMMKLFEVFIVRKDNKDVDRFLAWGKDPQAIREKALLDAGITSEDYEASQVVVKFVAEFDFPEGEDAK